MGAAGAIGVKGATGATGAEGATRAVGTMGAMGVKGAVLSGAQASDVGSRRAVSGTPLSSSLAQP
jgi:hypothetical protein